MKSNSFGALGTNNVNKPTKKVYSIQPLSALESLIKNGSYKASQENLDEIKSKYTEDVIKANDTVPLWGLDSWKFDRAVGSYRWTNNFIYIVASFSGIKVGDHSDLVLLELSLPKDSIFVSENKGFGDLAVTFVEITLKDLVSAYKLVPTKKDFESNTLESIFPLGAPTKPESFKGIRDKMILRYSDKSDSFIDRLLVKFVDK